MLRSGAVDGPQTPHLTVTISSLYTTYMVVMSAVELLYRILFYGTNSLDGLFTDKKPTSAMHGLSAVAAGRVAGTGPAQVPP